MVDIFLSGKFVHACARQSIWIFQEENKVYSSDLTRKNAETKWPSNGGLPIRVRGADILQTKLARIMHYRLYNVDYGSFIMFHESNFY